jgi:hypothetical protein|tara:strand:+ start:581 stop:748 length:168 start_codon:yes stop_codon:yes gene_type:complete
MYGLFVGNQKEGHMEKSVNAVDTILFVSSVIAKFSINNVMAGVEKFFFYRAKQPG